ncbi:DUF2971 domain-containing protein [uncultured Enterovirga sp.]|uniref:DUF2971 domain-containing protein n=1 Tax=uncultured Enterovirga sp. TaxID=2026352 RepID=UPI0035CA5525
MNDPFDVYISDLFEQTVEQRYEQSYLEIFEMIVRDPTGFASLVGAKVEEVQKVSRIVASDGPGKWADLIKALPVEQLEMLDPGFSMRLRSLEAERQAVVDQLQSMAVFCATHDRANLLMWAHYAEQHRGVVLGLRPNIERDSFLRLLRPVEYTDARPKFYPPMNGQSPLDTTSRTQLDAFFRRMIYSKSTHWSYEREERIHVPWAVPEGRDAVYYSYHPDELAEVCLGCRATDDFKVEICKEARRVNAHVSLFEVHPSRNNYELEFQAIP